jgi:hypothetical protein
MGEREQQDDRRRRRAVIIAATAVQAVVGTVTVRDVLRRQPDELRGPKALWVIWGGANTLGSAVYWLFGRKRRA